MLRRALQVRVRQAQEIVRVGIIESHVPRSAREECITAIDVENKKLVEPLVAPVAAKFKAVIADDPAVVVRELERIADLRQLAACVVANGETRPANGDERHSFKFGAHTRVNATVHCVCGPCGASGVNRGGITYPGEAES